MTILAIDPAKGCTGWALLAGDHGPDGRLLHAGTIQIDEEADTHVWVAEMMRDIKGLQLEYQPEVTVVELPFARRRGGPKSRRSPLTLPTYGIAVGAAIAGAISEPRVGSVMTVAVDTWAAGMPAAGEYKIRRVQAAAHLYGRTVESFGARTIAGNVADAVLLARWVMLNKVRMAVA